MRRRPLAAAASGVSKRIVDGHAGAGKGAESPLWVRAGRVGAGQQGHGHRCIGLARQRHEGTRCLAVTASVSAALSALAGGGTTTGAIRSLAAAGASGA